MPHADPRHVRRVLDNTLEARAPVAAALVAAGLAASWAAHRIAGGAPVVPPHLFYVPIGFAALRFGLAGCLPTAVAAAVLAGPLLPGRLGEQQATTDWIGRGFFFVLIGAFLAMLGRQLHRARAREADLAGQERDLHERQAIFVRNVSHELRTPLTIIIGGVITLRRIGEFSDERARRVTESLQRAADRLEQMIEMVLCVAEIGQPKSDGDGDRYRLEAEAIDVQTLVRDIVQTLSATGAGERVVARVDEASHVIVAPRRLLRNALSCLIDNALKFSPRAESVEVQVAREGGHVRFRVIDRGPGIPAEFVERATMPFEQWDRRDARTAGGLGLGLYVAKACAERLGGRLDIRTSPQDGTAVIVTVPQLQQAHEEGRAELLVYSSRRS